MHGSVIVVITSFLSPIEVKKKIYNICSYLFMSINSTENDIYLKLLSVEILFLTNCLAW